MKDVTYVVNYGTPFNIRSKSFTTEWEARNFINTHIFGDLRYCSMEKVEKLNVDFEYLPHYTIKDKTLRDQMFDRGIIRKDLYEQTKQE